MGLFTYRCPGCGASVKKGAKYCPNCGRPGPGARVTCGRCGEKNRADATHCWNCGADLSAVAPPEVKDGLWRREPDDFAARIEADSLSGRLAKGIRVEQGTIALLFQNGKLLGELPPGGHTVGGVLGRIRHLSASEPSTIVLVDSGDVRLHLSALDLFAADDIRVDAHAEVILRLSDGQAFFENLFRARLHISVPELEEHFSGELRNALAELASRHSAFDLVGSARIKRDLASVIEESLKESLGRCGFELVGVGELRFSSEAAEALRDEGGKVSQMARRAELDRRVREILTSDKMDELQSEKEFEDFVRRQEHELGIKDVLREQEMTQLVDEFRRRKEEVEQAHRLELAKKEKEAQIRLRDLEQSQDVKETEEAIRLRKASEQAEIEAERERAELELERKKAEQALEIERKKGEVEVEAARLRARAEATARDLISILDGPAAERLARLEELKIKQGFTPEQLLVVVAAESPEAARALAERYKLEAGAGFVDEKRKAADESVDRMERLVREVMERMGDVARSAAGGGGRPGEEGGVRCPDCGRSCKPGAKFCPHCGAELAG